MDHILGYGDDRTYARLVGRYVIHTHLTQLHTISGVLDFKPYQEYLQSGSRKESLVYHNT